MITYTSRNAARIAAITAQVERYRTKNGEVHFFGVMPNSNKSGWYTAGYRGW